MLHLHPCETTHQSNPFQKINPICVQFLKLLKSIVEFNPQTLGKLLVA